MPHHCLQKLILLMSTNHQTDSCIAEERGAVVFWAPEPSPRRQGSKVQIIDVFSLQVATGYTRDPQGKLLLEAQSSVASGRNWSVAKAAQLIRNDTRPYRWVALELDKRAWGLFWAGGGLQRCRELLVKRASETDVCSALVPVSAEALLRLMLDLKPDAQSARKNLNRIGSQSSGSSSNANAINAWKLVAWTSLAWMAVLGIMVGGFMNVLERQDRKLELLLQRDRVSVQSAR